MTLMIMVADPVMRHTYTSSQTRSINSFVYRTAKRNLHFIKGGRAEDYPMEEAKAWHRSGRNKIFRSMMSSW